MRTKGRQTTCPETLALGEGGGSGTGLPGEAPPGGYLIPPSGTPVGEPPPQSVPCQSARNATTRETILCQASEVQELNVSSVTNSQVTLGYSAKVLGLSVPPARWGEGVGPGHL